MDYKNISNFRCRLQSPYQIHRKIFIVCSFYRLAFAKKVINFEKILTWQMRKLALKNGRRLTSKLPIVEKRLYDLKAVFQCVWIFIPSCIHIPHDKKKEGMVCHVTKLQHAVRACIPCDILKPTSKYYSYHHGDWFC